MVVLVLEFQNQLDFDLILNVFRGVVNGKEGEAAALPKFSNLKFSVIKER